MKDRMYIPTTGLSQLENSIESQTPLEQAEPALKEAPETLEEDENIVIADPVDDSFKNYGFLPKNKRSRISLALFFGILLIGLIAMANKGKKSIDDHPNDASSSSSSSMTSYNSDSNISKIDLSESSSNKTDTKADTDNNIAKSDNINDVNDDETKDENNDKKKEDNSVQKNGNNNVPTASIGNINIDNIDMPTIANAIGTAISKTSKKEKKEKVDKKMKVDKEKSEKDKKIKDEKMKKDDKKKTKEEKVLEDSVEAINEIKNIFIDAVNDYAPSPLNVPSPTPPMP